MLHEIKRSLGENANQEYINHINLLKIIKQDIEEEKSKFKERTQGAEISLFIENIFEVASHEHKSAQDLSTPGSLVKTVLEKKLLIEKLQEKMNQRLEIINNLLANHTLVQATQNYVGTPNVVKNNIKMINLNFGQCKYNLNFSKRSNDTQLDWSTAFKKAKGSKPKRNLNKMKASFQQKKHFSQHEMYPKKRASSNIRTIAHEIMSKSPFLDRVGGSTQQTPMGKTTKLSTAKGKFTKNRRRSIDGIKTLANQLLEADSDDDDETPNNVRLYFDTKNMIGSEIIVKESLDNSQNKLEEESAFPIEIKPMKRPMQTISSFGYGGKPSKNRITTNNSKDSNLKFLGMMQFP